MFIKQNKLLILGTLAVSGIFLAIHFMWVSENWAQAASKLKEAGDSQTEWEKNYKTGGNLLPKSEAEKALDENNKSLKAGLATLQQIEFGNKETLQPFSEAAAGNDDRKNFLMKKRTTTYNKAKGLNVLCTSELGQSDKVADDPVPLNLVRLAIIDSFLTDCSKSKIPRITKIQYFPPKVVGIPGEEEGESAETEKKPAKGGKGEKGDKDAPAAERSDRLVQFPVKVQVVGAEAAINKLLYEIQKPTDRARGYLCLRGFHVSVRQVGSGSVEAVLGFSAMLNEKVVRDLGIQVKEDVHRGGGGPPRDLLDRGY